MSEAKKFADKESQKSQSKNDTDRASEAQTQENSSTNQENSASKSKTVADYEAEISELKETILRIMADGENAKKRLINDRDSAIKYAITGVVKDLALLMDNFYLCTSNVKEVDLSHTPFKSFFEAIKLTLLDVSKLLEKNNVRKINPLNEPFNPKEHDAVSQVKVENTPPNMVIQVLSTGYAIEDRVIKPAVVVVSG